MRVILLIFIIFIAPVVTYAEDTQFKQQILPIDCVYEVIDTGTQKLRYLTPETCPVDPGPPIVTEPVVQEPGSSNVSVDQPQWVYYPAVTEKKPEPSATTQPPNGSIDGSVKGGFANIKDVIQKNNDVLWVILIATTATALYLLLVRKKRL